MRVRWLGWAGVELESDGQRLVIDPLEDPVATFAPLGYDEQRMELPELAPAAAGGALAGLVTHLHRDHADAGALAAALAPGAPVFEPPPPPSGGEPAENLALAQASAELDAAAVARTPLAPWQSRALGPFAITALPAVDGLGDPQVAWLVESHGRRVLHLGDTIFHSYWWRMARRHGPFDLVLAPINGAVVSFPHLQPPSPFAAAMEPEQAVAAAAALGAAMVAPIHYGGFHAEGLYAPVTEARERFLRACASQPFEACVLRVAEPIELE
ncbi:MAG TPA: MBL fold metallo-hydrolase [Solirubrobacteraceae bacterium]|nr:MBL fold metallo-hydrolase [Solirubrobacteraceae bacterium]